MRPANNENPDLDETELQDIYADAPNHSEIDDFESMSPEQMHTLVYDFYLDKSPIQLVNHPEATQEIPIVKQTFYLLQLASVPGGIKLTARGNLPPAVVKDIYSKGWLKEEKIESGISKLSKEQDSMTVELTRILCEESGLAKHRKNIFTLIQDLQF